MAEIFTISGASAMPFSPFGYIPANLRKIDIAQQSAGTNAPPAVVLQNALKALGAVTGDPVLKSLVVDGKLGPKTVTAVNRALAKYVGATKYFPRADLQLVHVKNHTSGIAQLIVERVQKSGGTIPPPVVVQASASARKSATPFVVPAPESPGFDKKYIWWIVGGVSALLVLGLASSAVRRRKATA